MSMVEVKIPGILTTKVPCESVVSVYEWFGKGKPGIADDVDPMNFSLLHQFVADRNATVSVPLRFRFLVVHKKKCVLAFIGEVHGTGT